MTEVTGNHVSQKHVAVDNSDCCSVCYLL